MVYVEVDYKQETDLAALPAENIKCYMRSSDRATLKVDGVNATVTDITSGTAPIKSQWRIAFRLREADVDTPGRWLINFKVTFSDGTDIHHPDGSYLALRIVRSLA